MSKQLTGSAKKVQNFLMSNGFSCTVKELPDSTRTAEETDGKFIDLKVDNGKN